MGDSRERIRAFPAEARYATGHNLLKVQLGQAPTHWRPMPSIGPGVNEIRVNINAGIYRTIYVGKFAEAVYVLHAFRKKTQKTAKSDVDLAKQRLKDVMRMR